MADVEARQRDGFEPGAVGEEHDAPAVVHMLDSHRRARWTAGKLILYRYGSSRGFIAHVVTLISR